MEKNDRKEHVIEMIKGMGNGLHLKAEDRRIVRAMIDAYFRKRKGIASSQNEITAAALLWVYSKINFLWEPDESWKQQNIAKMLNVKPKTVGNKSAEICKALKIGFFDERFCRKEVADKNPWKQFVAVPSGLILSKDMAEKMNKGDYFYDGLEFLQGGKKEKAISCFKEALKMDGNYVDAYNGMASVYFYENLAKAKEYYQKAFEFTRKHFKNKWPRTIEWGVLENRQYLRAMHGLGLVYWKEGKLEEAKELFQLMLRLNNNDNQGARYLVAAILEGLSWSDSEEMERKAMRSGDYSREEKIFEKQNKIHKFYKYLGE